MIHKQADTRFKYNIEYLMSPMSYRTYVNIDVHLREGVKKKL